MRSTSSREYRISRELRRCCWYVIGGAFVIAAVYAWTVRIVPNRDPVAQFLAGVQIALVAAAMVIPLRWKIRVNEQGVSRRFLFHWDLWSWEDLASGRVSKRHAFILYDAKRPWWRRTLQLGYMNSDDIQELMSIVNRHYKLPPPPSVPATLEIRFGVRRSAMFTQDGVHLTGDKRPRSYRWHDLRGIHIIRMDPLRRDFKRLEVTLPDQTLIFRFVSHQGGTSPTWRGATPEELNEFLFRYAPAECIHVSIADQPLEKPEHIESKLKETTNRTRDLTVMMVVFLPLCLGILVWMAIDDGIVKATAMGVQLLLFPGSILWFLCRKQRKEIAALRNSLSNAKKR